MIFSRIKKKYITVEEMNAHLKYVKGTYELIFREKRSDETVGRKAFIEDKMVHFQLTYQKGSDLCSYICRKDTKEHHQTIDGGEAFRVLSKYYKVPRMPEDICGKSCEGGLSASPIIYVNPKYDGTRNYAYGYDLNSAYSSAMLGDMPDTSKKWRVGNIVEGSEIGFEERINDKTGLTMLVPKCKGFSLYVFPLIESPFKDFVKAWYKKKVSNPSGSKEREKAKEILNFSVGYLQKVNPFLRATIIGRCNELISSMIDENTLFCNTDSIVSLKPLDLKIGNGIGEWKLEHEGLVAYKGNNYQWSDGSISFRGIPKHWFKKNWDILKDEIPRGGNMYKFENMRLRLSK